MKTPLRAGFTLGTEDYPRRRLECWVILQGRCHSLQNQNQICADLLNIRIIFYLTQSLENSPFMRACRGEAVEYTPIWLMRQAGRYMREYREVRARTTFLELCKKPELAAQVTVTAVERLGVDAAIIFADILLILEPLGIELEFAAGEGPVIHNPVRGPADV